MPRPHTDEELLEIVRTVRLNQGSVCQAARILGKDQSNITRALKKAQHRWPEGFPTDAQGASAVAPPTPAAIPAADTAPLIDEVVARRDQIALQAARNRIADLQKRIITVEDQRNTLLLLDASPLAPLPARRRAPTIQKKTRLVPMLFTSDFQCGEVIRPEEVDGLNAYNKDIFAERYDTLITDTIGIADHHTGASEFPGCYYLRGGDAISGEIHLELADTNDLSAVPAVQWLLRHEREGIKRLRDRFGHVHVVSIPGNHGRTNFGKSRSKGYVEHSFETLLAWWLASSFADDPRVKFWAPKSGDAYFNVEGWNIGMFHGDRIGSRGGQGFVGPAATIARGHQKVAQNYAASGKPIDYVLSGHMHTSLKLQRGYSNGSLAGYGEFARDIQALPDAPKQWAFFVHERRGIAQAFEVQCGDRPKRLLGADFTE